MHTHSRSNDIYAVTVTLTVAVSVTVSFSVAVTVTVKTWLGAMGVMISGPSVVLDDATGDEGDGEGGCGEAFGEEETCAGIEDAAGDDDCAGGPGTGVEDVGLEADKGDDCGGAATGEEGAGATGGDGGLGTGSGTEGLVDGVGPPPVGAGATVVYSVMTTTGGGSRGVGERVAGEVLEDGSTGWEACTGVVPVMSSDPPTGVKAVGEGSTVVYSVLVTTTGEFDAEPVTTGAIVDCVMGLGDRVELTSAELSELN